MMWKAFQLSIFVAVLFSNVHFQWTPNGYVACAVALFAALLGTAIVNLIFDLAAWCRLLLALLRGHQRTNERLIPRA